MVRLRRKKLDPVVPLGVDWCVAIQFINDKEFIIMNVYAPYECHSNKDESINKLEFMASAIQELHITSVHAVGI